MPEPIYLCGDMALRAGLAIGSPSRGLIASCVVDVHAVRKRSLGAAVKLMQTRIVQFVAELGVKPEVLIYEMPTNTQSTHVLPQYGMCAALAMAADTCGCSADPIGIWPISLKAKGTGNAKACKEQIIAHASEYAGRQIDDDNEADAILLLKVAIEFPELLEPRGRKSKSKAKGKAKPKATKPKTLF